MKKLKFIYKIFRLKQKKKVILQCDMYQIAERMSQLAENMSDVNYIPHLFYQPQIDTTDWTYIPYRFSKDHTLKVIKY